MSSRGKNSLTFVVATKWVQLWVVYWLRVIILKGIIKEYITIALLGLLIPALIAYHVSRKIQNPEPPAQVPKFTTEPEPGTAAVSAERTITVLMDSGSVEEISLDAYVTGVVLAEMPTSFEEEALKAQAVASRTYALRKSQLGLKHDPAGVCTSAACCQAYLSKDAFLSRGGTEADYAKVCSAVEFTTGQVLFYQDELIEATYFSCSGGKTESALAVWGAYYPYLIAQPSPGEEGSVQYVDSQTLSRSDFLEKLGLDDPGIGQAIIGAISYTEGDGVDRIQICGQTYAGTELRKIFGLRSTNFLISCVGESVTITTKGYGHRVGMSQYGADAMAVDGSTYQEILAYYYPGTQIGTVGTD